MIDIGANLTNKAFNTEIEGILDHAKSAGLSDIIITGTSIEGSLKAQTLSKTHHDIKLHFTAGIHPHQASSYNTQAEKTIQHLSIEAIAIGECGLDYNRMFSTIAEQKTAFEGQMNIAKNANLPTFLHERDAFDDFYQIIKQYPDIKKIVHCFTGNKETLSKYLDEDCFIGITGWITDSKKNQNLLNALHYIPLNKLMIETDAPYLKPRNNNHKEKICFPHHLPSILDFIANYLKQNKQELNEIIIHNTQTFFNLPTNKIKLTPKL